MVNERISLSWKWMGRFIDLLEHPSGWSKDPSTQVGAILVSPDKRVVLPGYNGFPPSVPDRKALLDDRPSRLARTIHAEQNVLQTAARAGLRLAYPTGWILFTTHCPCSRCASIIADSGVSLVVYERRSEFEKRWKEDLVQSHLIFQEARISVLRRSVGVTTPRKSETDENRAYDQYLFAEPDPSDGTFQLGESNTIDDVRLTLIKARDSYREGMPLKMIQHEYGVAYDTSRSPEGRIEQWFVLGGERIKLEISLRDKAG